MIHFTPSEDRLESTRTQVLREPELVPIQFIRPTELVSPLDCSQIRYSPICLVKHPDGLLYIVDGNHRFFKKRFFEKECSKIVAWVLREGDQDKFENESIPDNLLDWKNGKITLDRLTRRARFESEGIIPPGASALMVDRIAIYPVRANQTKIDPEWPATRKSELVIKLINSELSIEEAISKYSLPRRTIEEWIHISIRAIREAPQD